ncbi:MAG: ABC transporter ATP-binding protein [Candidatus Spyradocola sp.]|jgi:ABC-2 type transport system ATP-binding protein
MDAILQVEHLTKRYPNFTLEDVSFSLPKGTVMGLIGENGAGKSTTLHALLDLIHKDGGSVTFWGQPLSASRQIREDIGIVLDDVNFYATLTPQQVGRILRAAYRQWDDTAYSAYLTRFGLPLRQEIQSLSKGMRMKLLIAAALSHKPKLLILDEATSGLDPVMRDEILDVFWDFVQDEEHAILLSSHISTDLERIADTITFLHQGRLVFCKPKDELLYRYGILRCGQADFAKIDKADILACRREDYQWSVLVADKEAARRKYRPQVLDDATIDEILLLYVKGEQTR